MRLYKPKYTKPLPEGTKVLRRRDGRYAKYKGKLAPLTKAGDRILVETAHWHIGFEDNIGIRRDIKAYTDRAATQRLADRIQDLLNCKANNAPLTDELQKFVEQLSGRIRDELAGFLDLQKTAAGKPLAELVDEFEQFIAAKECNPQYLHNTITELKRLLEDCGFEFWSEISPSKVTAFLKSLRVAGLSFRRSNGYLKAAKMFCKWMVDSLYVSQSPIQHLKMLDVKLDKRHERRAIEPDELRRLLETTAAGPERYGLTGPERGLLYRFAVETGLRANEIRTLKISAFDFDELTVTVRANYSKHRREDVLPLRRDTAEELRRYLANKLPGAKVFYVTDRTAKMLQSDLKDAGIAYKDESGRYFDFHALRHQCGTLLAASGVNPKVAQSIMRHSDINLTMSLYTHTLRGQESEAVESLPSLAQPSKQKQVRTGTDDKNLRNSCFTHGQSRTQKNGNGQKSVCKAQKTPLQARSEDTVQQNRLQTQDKRLKGNFDHAQEARLKL